jgi:RND family efflux transporter MFP subunit
MKHNRNIIIVGIIGALLFTACGKQKKDIVNAATGEAIPVKIITLNKTDVCKSIFSSGQFTTDDETSLSFKTGGLINNVFVKAGDRIKKGQLLATLNPTEILSQVNQAQFAFDKATRDLSRAENLFRDSVISLEQLQNSRTALDMVQQQLQSAKFNLQYSEIRASNDGVVLDKLANEGQIIGSGMPVLKTSNKGSTDWILRVAVSDNEWAQIAINDKAKVQIEALNYNNLEGYVYAKAENADMMTGSFVIDLKLKNAQQFNIASGMFGKAEIKTSNKSNVWQIPYESLLDGNNNQGFVFVTNDKKHAMRVPVTIAALNTNEIIISEGLSNYNSLIVAGSAYLRDKSPIVVINK